jgi:glycosyltransferase involved in cell wall biosynthesis
VKILLAISEVPPQRSGVARVAARLGESFTTAGHHVDVLSIEDVGRVVIGEFRLTGLLRKWRDVRKRVASADIVSVFGPVPTFSDVLLLLLAVFRKRGRPRVVYTHVFDIDFPGAYSKPVTSLYNWVHRQLARVADRVVVPTPSYARVFEPFSQVEVIPWGFERVADAHREKDYDLTLLFVGQLRPYKGVSTLIRAAAQAPQTLVLVAGDGPGRASLEREAESLGAFNVRFLGAVSDEDLRNLYARAHAVVLPSVSRLEAFGIVLLEGMSASCVPIASNIPGVHDVVGDAGYTFTPGDASALAKLLSNIDVQSEEWKSLSRKARERSMRFSWEYTATSYLRCYDSLLGTSPAKSQQAMDEPLVSRSGS